MRVECVSQCGLVRNSAAVNKQFILAVVIYFIGIAITVFYLTSII